MLCNAAKWWKRSEYIWVTPGLKKDKSFSVWKCLVLSYNSSKVKDTSWGLGTG